MEQILNLTVEQLEERIKEEPIEQIRKTLRYLKKVHGALVYDKHHYERIDDSKNLALVREKIKRVRKMEDILQRKIESFPVSTHKRERNEHIPVYLRMEASSFRDLTLLSTTLLGEEMGEQIKSLDSKLDSEKKLQILGEVIPTLEGIHSHIKCQEEKLYQEFAELFGIKINKSMKKEVHNRMKDTLYEPFQVRLDYYRETLLQINRVLERLYTLRGIYKTALLKQEKEEMRREENIFLDNDKEIILDFVSAFFHDDSTLKENVHSFLNKDILEEFDAVCASLEKITDIFMESFVTLHKENIVCLCNVMKNKIIARMNEIKSYLPKEDAQGYTRELKKVAKIYEKMKKASMEKKEKVEKTDAYYDLFEVLLKNPNNYYYASKILDIVEDKLPFFTIERLVEEVITLFAQSHRLKIEGQTRDVITPNYYCRILILFEKKELISNRMQVYLSNCLEELKEYACSKKESISKDAALRDIEKLQQGGWMLSYVEEKEKIATLEVKKAVQERLQYINKDSKVEKNTDYRARTFALGNLAYSIQYNEEGNQYFRVHLLDTSHLIFEDTKADEIIKKHMLLNQKVPFDLSYKKNITYPVLTFQYRIYNNNSSRLKMFEDTISIDEVYNKSDLKNYREIPDLKALIASYKRIWEAEVTNDINKQVEDRICDEILMLLKNCTKEVPCMYKQSLKRSMERTKEENMLSLGHILYKIDKKVAHKIWAILEEDIPPIYTTSITEETYLELQPFSYETIHLYRSIKRIWNETYDFYEEYNRNKAEIQSYCQAYNEQYGYVDGLSSEKGAKKVKRN